MKKVLSILILLTIGHMCNCGQSKHPLPKIDDQINFSEVVTIDGMIQDELYMRSKLESLTKRLQ